MTTKVTKTREKKRKTMQDWINRPASRWRGLQNRRRIARLAREVAAQAPRTGQPGAAPVIFFNATARLADFSLNAAFMLLAGWGARLAGIPVVHFVCRAGMSHCVLGTARRLGNKTLTDNDPAARQPPPCQTCLRQSERLHTGAFVRWFTYQRDTALAEAIKTLNIGELAEFTYPDGDIPLGRLVLPSLRWALRRHTLPDDETTCYLLREFILSAHSIIREFTALLDETQPRASVIFNGILYPEAAARWAAQRRGVRVISQEVGFQRFSAFFSDGDATAYPIHIPDDFTLTPQQDALLDKYLEKRFQGKFTMAGIRFWPEMRGLDEAFLLKAAQFQQLVPVFTNVVYDTSQVHANQVFPHMFAWLDMVLGLVRRHPETLFVLRAHPDEMRPGTAKQSRESVRQWLEANSILELPNVAFIDSQEYISSYELIQRAKFVVVYNSSIGMEAALMGAAVLCGGQARYTQYPMVFFPQTPQAFQEQAEELLAARRIDVPSEFKRNARRFLYYQLFRVSLGFEDFLQEGMRQGFVELKDFPLQHLLLEKSPTMRTLVKGILGEGAFEVEG